MADRPELPAFIKQLAALSETYRTLMANKEDKARTTVAESAKMILRDMAVMIDAHYARADDEALIDMHEGLLHLSEFFQVRHDLPHGTGRTTSHDDERVPLPADGVRCPSCDVFIPFKVDGRFYCGNCAVVYRPVTWLVCESEPPNRHNVQYPPAYDLRAQAGEPLA